LAELDNVAAEALKMYFLGGNGLCKIAGEVLALVYVC